MAVNLKTRPRETARRGPLRYQRPSIRQRSKISGLTRDLQKRIRHLSDFRELINRTLQTDRKPLLMLRGLRLAAAIAILAAIYILAAKLGLSLAFIHVSASAVWPPTGIALAAFLLFGYRVWPAIAIGAFLANLTTEGTVATSLGIAAGNTLEGLVGAYVVNRFAHGRYTFDRSRDIFKFALLAAVFSTAISATFGVTSLSLGGFANWGNYGPIWLTWWLGDAAGALVVTPLLILWSMKSRTQWRREQTAEATLFLIALLSVAWVIFSGIFPFSYLTVPLLLWVAFRFGQREVATTIAALSIIAIWATLHGTGPFVGQAQNESLLLLQAFMGIMSLMTLPLSAVVTEHKEAGDTLSRQADLYGALLQAQSDVGEGFILTEGRRIIYANDASHAISGYTPEELITLPSLFQLLAPDQRPILRKRFLARLVGKHVPDHYETAIIHKDGSRVDVEVAVKPIRLGPRIQLAAIVRDITERKKAEERQRFLATASELMTESLDFEEQLRRLARLAIPNLADWSVIDVLEDDHSIRQVAIAHHDLAKEILVRKLRERFPPGPNHPIMRVIRTGESELATEVTDRDLRRRARNAEHFHLLRKLGIKSHMVVPLIARGRALGAVSLIYSDSNRRYKLHDMALAEELIRRAATAIDNTRLYRETQEALRARDEFLSIAAHELKTPLTSLKISVQNMIRSAQRGYAPGQAIEMLSIAEKQADRLGRLVNDMLDVSRIETGQLHLLKRKLNLSTLIQHVISRTQPLVSKRTFSLRAPEELTVLADSDRIEQVFTNLLSNALKYSPDKSKVYVRVRRAGAKAIVSVKDEGKGIPRSVQKHLFLPFFKLAGAQSPGLGLGLYIAHKIIEQHNGDLSVQSRPGHGSTFLFSLPLYVK